jgi:thiamine monophosphate synthase
VSGLEILGEVVHAIPLPIIAIGGVSAENTGYIMKTGARGIAVISAVCCQKDPEGATRALYAALEEAAKGGADA